MGEYLAQKIIKQGLHHDVDVVIPIPDTSRSTALQVAHHLGVKYREGFIKNRHWANIHYAWTGNQKKSVKQKLNPIDLEIRDKNVLLIDDSIVRGTTSKKIIKWLETQALKSIFASAAPPVKYPNVYGIDMPSIAELLASNRTEEELARYIGADCRPQELDDLISAVQFDESDAEAFHTPCFSVNTSLEINIKLS